MTQNTNRKTRIGWREWVGLPGLGVDKLKAKIDTGARTSAIHAFDVTPFKRDGKSFVRFKLHPVQKHREPEVECEAEILERRRVTSSTGQREMRYIIETDLALGSEIWPIELSLANRDQLGFRMLVGRQAVRGNYLIDPGSSYRLTRKRRKKGSKPR